MLSKIKSSLFLFILLYFSFPTFGQNNHHSYNLLFQKKKVHLEENFKNLTASSVTTSEIVEGKYFRLIQFYEIPNTSVKEKINKLGIELLQYIPNKAYYASIPSHLGFEKIKELPIRNFSKIKKEWKESQAVGDRNFEEWAFDGKLIHLSVVYFKNISKEYVEQKLEGEEIFIAKSSAHHAFLELHIPLQKVNQIASFPFVIYVDQTGNKGTPEDEPFRNLQRSNMLDSSYPMGRHYKGEGIKVLIRDAGGIGPHIDFKGRIIENETGGTGHEDLVSGVAGGAGNLDPRNRGAATGIEIYALNYTPDFANGVMDLHQNEGVLLTNSSFSDQCNSGYNINASIVDLQVFQNPTLMHIFSAGNSGGTDCDYGAGPGWGNITGGNKTGKNVIAVGNVYDDRQLVNNSSRGPAMDGRIKPDICANGNVISTIPNNVYSTSTGTSMSSPAVTGVMAQLYQAYQELNDSIPESALIKAILLNTADDIENEGPDFKSGWGVVNAYRAIRLLEGNLFFNDKINQGETNTYFMNIPSGAQKIKIMVYWADQEATAGVAKGLVNDLDMTLIDPMGGVHLPWVLDTFPSPMALDAPAIHGQDHLNNMEQITIHQPAAGTYTIDISGFEIPFGDLKYHVVHEVITDEITMTFPNGGESLVRNEIATIHWDANNKNTDYILEYTADNGNIWNPITTVDSTVRIYDWTVPNVSSGEVRVRVSNGISIDESDANFSIADLPHNLTIEKVCYNSILISWGAATSATAYEVFQLGEKYMDSIGTTTDLEFEIPISNPTEEHWFSVRAIGDDGKVSRRTYAQGYGGDVLNCITPTDIASKEILQPSAAFFIDCFSFEESVAFQIENKGMTTESNFEVSYQLNNEPIVTEIFTESIDTGMQIIYTFFTPMTLSNSGMYNLKVWSSVNNDPAKYNDTLMTTFEVNLNVPITDDLFEGFESTIFPPSNWFISNPDNHLTWEKRTVIGSDGNPSPTAFIRNYDYNGAGQRDELASFTLDLMGLDSPSLAFDLSYAPFSTTSLNDVLQIEIYGACGNQLSEIIYSKTGLDLASVPNISTSPWLPNSSDDWKKEILSLANFVDDTITIKFVNICGFGNNLYLDNINVYRLPLVNVEDVKANFQVDLFPNPNDGNFNLKIESQKSSDYQISFFDINGKLLDHILLKNNNVITSYQFDYQDLASGVCFLKIKNESGVIVKKVVIEK